MTQDLIRRAQAAFRDDADAPPAMTLRGGDAVDGYYTPPPYDPAEDEPTDAYIEQYAYWGFNYLDPASWRHYLPLLIDFSLRNATREATPRADMVVEAVLWALRPPERDPPRFAVLTEAQEAVIVDFLEFLAFDDSSDHQEFAMQVLEEYWMPGALYR
jgi:hypothetical protein